MKWYLAAMWRVHGHIRDKLANSKASVLSSKIVQLKMVDTCLMDFNHFIIEMTSCRLYLSAIYSDVLVVDYADTIYNLLTYITGQQAKKII